MLGIYDHGGGGFVDNLKQAAQSLKIGENILFSRQQLCESNELNKYSIVVCHLSREEDWENILTNSPPNAVRVRVSSVGFSKTDNKPLPRLQDNKIYELYLVLPAKKLRKEQWQEILQGISDLDNLKALVAGRNPQRLRSFFVHEEEWLAALSILCQGYLAVHAQSRESREGKMGKALKKMGWTEDFIREQGNTLQLSSLGSKIGEVRALNWWLNGLGSGEELRGLLTKEWQALDDSSMSEPLELLLAAMVNESQIQSPELVAEVYLAIADKLGDTKRGENDGKG
jgi:hypothetical protein